MDIDDETASLRHLGNIFLGSFEWPHTAVKGSREYCSNGVEVPRGQYRVHQSVVHLARVRRLGVNMQTCSQTC
jgi:hypothetical protein